MTDPRNLYEVRVASDTAEAETESAAMLAVRTLVQDNIEAGVDLWRCRIPRVYYAGHMSTILTMQAYQIAKEMTKP